MKKTPRKIRGVSLDDINNFHRFSASVKSFFIFGDEFNGAVFDGVDGVIVAAPGVFARDKFRAALADDDVSDFRFLAAEKFHAEPSAFRIAAQTSGAAGLSMCHNFINFEAKRAKFI